jgi:hypothetical protein
MIMVVVCTHTATIVEQQFAEQAVAAVPFDVLYARVDIIRDNTGKLAIMELEMIEPELFFRYKPEAADSWPAVDTPTCPAVNNDLLCTETCQPGWQTTFGNTSS